MLEIFPKPMKHLLFAFLLLSPLAKAQLRVARIFTEHAVLQRQKPISVWGWAAPKEKITLTFANQTQQTTVSASGKWTLQLAPMEAGGPFTMTIKGKTNSLTLSDILVGEVWLCSGQSNMEWTVNSSDNAPSERSMANFSQIRHLKIANDLEIKPLEDLKTDPKWQVCSPEIVGDFTAVGYFFARELAQKLNIPVGLVNSSWGGSQVEGWISKEAMESSDELRDYAKTIPNSWEEASKRLDDQLKKHAFGRSDVVITAQEEARYPELNYDFSKWHQGYSPGSWDWQGFWAYRGQGYSAKKIEVSASMATQPTTLGLGENDSFNQVYINGKLIFEGVTKGKRELTVAANTWKTGTNVLMLKYGVTSEPNWFGLGVYGPAEDLFLKTKDEKQNLGGDGWYLMPALAEKYEFARLNNNIGTSIYNAMIAPIVPFTLRGTIWYQGETNANRAYQYQKTFPLLINDWRQRWNDEFPFYYVQLTCFGSNKSANEGSNWAELREAQTKTLSLPKTGMAVITDIGNPADIHPTNKQDVGKRLAAIALVKDYGQKMLFESPMYESVKMEGNRAVVSFKNTPNGLVAKDKFGYLRGFEIAGEDKIFRYAQAQIIGNSVLVSHPDVAKPASVRYAWSNSPDDANLFSAEGLPANSFRSDNWKGTTEETKFK